MKNTRSIIYLILYLAVIQCFTPGLQAQDFFPEYNLLYDNTVLSRVDVELPADSLAWILAEGNEESDHEFMASVTFTNASNIISIDSVGFRLRGNTSRYSQKKSFKISLNTFVPGQKYQGVEKINLNGEHNDPSISRAFTSWELFRRGGVPGSRASFVDFYINGEYRGVYINVEHIDEEFVEKRYGNNDGNLYKCLYPADLVYKGESPALYKESNGERRAYELKTNILEDDYSDLADFISKLHYSDPGQSLAELNRVFNINSFLKYYALEVLIGHWDGYAVNKNNFYLYNNTGTGKLEFIPYDPDNTFGISWFGGDWTRLDIYSWKNEGESRPLVEKLMQNQVCKDRYSFYMKRLLDNYFNRSYLDPLLNSTRTLLAPSAQLDEYRVLDYDFTYSDFYDAFDSGNLLHVKRGIKSYIDARFASANSQLRLNEINPIITFMYSNNPDPGKDVEVLFMVEDDGAVENARVFVSTGGADFTQWPVFALSDGLYSVKVPGTSFNGQLKFYFEATDDQGNISRDPEQGYYSLYYGSVTGDQPKTGLSDIAVYPNPTKGQLFISEPASVHLQFEIRDLSGRKVQHGFLPAGEAQILLDDKLVPGIYLVTLKYDADGQLLGRPVKLILE